MRLRRADCAYTFRKYLEQMCDSTRRCMIGTASYSLLESLARTFGIGHQVAGTARLDCRTHVELLRRLWISASASSTDDRSCFSIVSHFRAQN
jgi:hypothetical protein